MEVMIGFFVDLVPKFIAWLSTLEIVPGVSLIGFFAAIIVIIILIRNFLYTAR